ncbi:MAG: LacI family DNA-binding transcriptional regulator [Chthoniobacteraceae bacterium]
MDRRPTQADVAQVAGVHRATVSLVFRNHPSIPEVTRRKVLDAAQKIGYSPDPMLSSLAAYRSRLRPKAFQGVIAWLVSDASWSAGKGKAFQEYYDGAAAQANTHGYKLEVFNIAEFAAYGDRLASIFRNRNIHGILLPPSNRSNSVVSFPWEEFSAVKFGYSIVNPQLHTVAAAQFRSTVFTMRQLQLLGYQRIGFFFDSNHDEKTDHNYLAGYFVGEYAAGALGEIPPLFFVDSEKFMQWYRKYRPDVIVTGKREILPMLDALGIRVPQDVALANPQLERDHMDDEVRMSGVYEDSYHIGTVAMDYLVGMIYRGERGIPERPQRILVEGVWYPGDTVRSPKSEP